VERRRPTKATDANPIGPGKSVIETDLTNKKELHRPLIYPRRNSLEDQMT
jgi:hypothetical protein